MCFDCAEYTSISLRSMAGAEAALSPSASASEPPAKVVASGCKATLCLKSDSASSAPLSRAPALPFLASLLHFEQLNADGSTVSVHLKPDGQVELPGATFSLLCDLARRRGVEELPIHRDEFQSMWQALLHKRSQDVAQHALGVLPEPQHYLRFAGNFKVPATLGVYLHAMGHYRSAALGVTYNVLPRRPSYDVPDWGVPEQTLLERWVQTMDLMSSMFEMMDFPQPSDCHGQPLMLAVRQVDQGICRVKAATNEPSPSDILLVGLTKALFADAPFDFAHSHLIRCPPFNLEQQRTEFVLSYAKHA